MRTETEIRKEMAARKVAVQEARATKPMVEVEKLTVTAKMLAAELVACLSEGANNCPTCGAPPHAMLKRQETYAADGSLLAGSVYELGCLAGHPEKDGKAHRAQGSTPGKAVENWNAGNWLKWTPPGSMTMTVTRADGTQETRVLEPKRGPR
jgi:hypothetical protein